MSYTSVNSLIESVDPTALQQLKDKYKSHQDLFLVHKELGDEREVIKSEDRAEALSALARTGTSSLRQKFDELLEGVRRKMRLSYYIKQSGALIATGAGVVTAFFVWQKLPDNSRGIAAFISAIVTAIGGLVASLSELVIRSPSGVAIASTEEYSKMISLRLDVERIDQRLARAPLSMVSEDELVNLLDELDKLSLQLLRYLVV